MWLVPKRSLGASLPGEQPVPPPETQPSRDPTGAEVLTLGEAAAYLRVSEEAVLKLVDEGTLPGQRIGDEWR